MIESRFDHKASTITDTLPAHGLVLGFNPTNRTLTYQLARGYCGFDRFIYHVSDGELNSAVVRFTLMNQNVYPAHSEDVLAALPIRATRANKNGNHTTFFNPKAEDVVRAVSHKV